MLAGTVTHMSYKLNPQGNSRVDNEVLSANLQHPQLKILIDYAFLLIWGANRQNYEIF